MGSYRFAVVLLAVALCESPFAQAFVPQQRRARETTAPSLPSLSAAFLSTTSITPEDTGDASASSASSSSEKQQKIQVQEVDWDWKALAAEVFETDKRPIVLFDGVCNLCNSGVNFAMDQDETAKLRFCSLQSKVAQSLLLREGKDISKGSDEISFITEKAGYFSSNAVSHICMELDSPPLRWFGALGQYTPPWIRESIFQVVSNNRYQFGENDSCRLDFDGTYTSRFVSDPDLAAAAEEEEEKETKSSSKKEEKVQQ